MNKQFVLWIGLVMFPLLSLTAILKSPVEIDQKIVSDLVHNQQALYAFERASNR
jgi:hypothetical protein